MPGNKASDGATTKGASLGAHPEGVTVRFVEYARPNDFKINVKVWKQQLWNSEFDGCSRLCFCCRYDDKPAVGFLDQMPIDLKRCQIFASHRRKGQQGDHQTVTIADCSSEGEAALRSW